MSSASPTHDDRIAPPRNLPDASAASRLARATVVTPVRTAAFWTAVLAPLAYVPLLAGGLDASQALTLLTMFAVHAVALVVGHGHGSR